MDEDQIFATPASDWVRRFVPLISTAGEVLDLACGTGRHTRLLLEKGYRVTAVDRDISRLKANIKDARLTAIEADLEDGGARILENQLFTGVIVTHYLHRPLFPAIRHALAGGGMLIYETFARGNESYGKPRNPDFLLRPNELIDVFGRDLHILAFEQGVVAGPAVKQRLAALNGQPPPAMVLPR